MRKSKFAAIVILFVTILVLSSCLTPKMSYQGKLTDAAGNPVPNGSYNVTFRLWNVGSISPVLVWQETQAVAVTDGLFNVTLGAVAPMTPSLFINPLELGIEVNGDGEMAPRQALLGAPYAMSLVDGAVIAGARNLADDPDYPAMLNVFNAGDSYGIGVRFVGEAGVAITGEWLGSQVGETGLLIEDVANGAVITSTQLGLKVTMPMAAGSHGIRARSESTVGSTWAVHASSDTAGGVLGIVTGSGTYAVRGSNSNGLGGYFWNNNATYYSLRGYNSAGSTAPGLRVDGTSYFSGAKSGYVADLCRAAEDLEPGDVVVIAGFEPAILGEVPVIVVRKATVENATGVVGVVDARQVVTPADPDLLNNPEANTAPVAEVRYAPGPIRAGDYLLVTTLGAYKAIKVDASAGPIQPGDLLTVSPLSGHAAKAQPITVNGVTFYAPGTIIGTAMDSLESGTGLIPVFVSAR